MKDEAEKKTHLDMAEALDAMDKALSSENASFLEKVLDLLKDGKPLNAKQEAKLEALHERYIESGEDTEDDIDEDDFV